MSDKMYRAVAIGRTGRGNWGHGLHSGLKNHPRVEVVAVADEDAEERQVKQEELAAPRAYADWREMLEAEQPEVVTVGPRWTDCHLEMVLACLEVGAHVYCEKPMTWNLAEGDQIVAKAEATGRKVAVAHQGAYMPRIRHVKEVLEQGRIGAVQAIRAHGKQDRRGGGEDMIVLGTHLFNMMRLFVGDVAWMTAHIEHEGRALTVEDVREATEPVGPIAGDCINSYFAFKSGVAGFFDSRKYVESGGARMGMEIEGSEGVIALRGGGSGPAMLYPHPVFDPTDASQQWVPLDEVADEALSTGNDLAVADLIDAAEADREPLSSARDAVAALEMILGAYEAEITGGRVEFPMQRREHPLVAWREGR